MRQVDQATYDLTQFTMNLLEVLPTNWRELLKDRIPELDDGTIARQIDNIDNLNEIMEKKLAETDDSQPWYEALLKQYPPPWTYKPHAAECGNGSRIDVIEDKLGNAVVGSYGTSWTMIGALWGTFRN